MSYEWRSVKYAVEKVRIKKFTLHNKLADIE